MSRGVREKEWKFNPFVFAEARGRLIELIQRRHPAGVLAGAKFVSFSFELSAADSFPEPY